MNDEQLTEKLVSMVERCTNEIDGNFRDCMVDQANQAGADECGLNVYLIKSEDCGGCATAQTELANLIGQQKIRLLDISDPLAVNLLQEMSAGTDTMVGVPSLVIADCQGHLVSELEILPQEE